MTPSRNIIVFIAQREAFVSVAYSDGINHAIGFGRNDPAIRSGDTTTMAAELPLFLAGVRERAETVDRALDWPVEQHEFDALVSLYYNKGTTALNDVASRLNDGDRSEAMAVLCTYNRKQDGTFSFGLAKRRWLELCIFRNADYGILRTIKVFDGDPKIVPPIEVPFPVEALA